MNRPDASAPITITAFQVAESIAIKTCRSGWKDRLLAASSRELFFGPPGTEPGQGTGAYTFILNYGVVIYAGRTEAEMETLNSELQAYGQNPLAQPLREEFRIQPGAAELSFGFTTIDIPGFTPDVLRIVMLYVGQSVALDYYENLANALFQGSNEFIEAMARYGKLKASRKTILKYIGQTMSMRNRIIDNLYVLDTPDTAWENEHLDRVDRGMKKTFDIETRFRALDDQLGVVKENLELFAELLQFRESNFLEWIIIALFVFEVARIFFE